MKDPINIHARTVEAPAPGLNLGDFYYIFFRHKWKIILFFLCGVLGAIGFYLVQRPVYVSEAKILIRYILESKNTTPGETDSQVKSPDSQGDNIINSEIEILTSLDLAVQAADAVGPEKILAALGGGADRMSAAAAIRRGLLVDVPRNSSILRITFRHPDPAVVQVTLSALADTYLKRHLAIHQGVGVLDDFFSREADQFRLRLSQTENELKELKTTNQVLSLEDDKRAVTVQKERVEQDLMTGEAELAQQMAALNALQTMRPNQPPPVVNETGIPAEVAEDYRLVRAELDSLRQQSLELHRRFTDEHPQIRRLTNDLAEAEQRRLTLEQTYTNITVVTPPPVVAGTRDEFDYTTQFLRVTALQAKMKVLTNQLAKVRIQMERVIGVEPELTQLQRRKVLEEASLRYYSSSLEQALNDESLGAGKITNIKVVQTPSPASRDKQEILKPVVLMLAFGLFGGFALAFALERFFDQSIKRIVDIERNLHVPVFVSIPDATRKLRGSQPSIAANGHTTSASNGHVTGDAAGGGNTSWEDRHGLRPYYEGLRDRLITYFEVRDLKQRPKLIGVTSCTRQAGVSTVAAGLAATLSETGDGNVLLVDMNLEQGAAQQFNQGRPVRGLSEALEGGSRAEACVSENFYVATAHESNNQKLPRVLPKRFAHLVPRMKASDYDYIVFDMPPVTQTSVTPRLAGFMDMVLMVVESEKTGQEIVRRGGALLHESRANYSVVLNKHRTYVPQRLSQEL